MKRERGSLRLYANAAKKRLASGFWMGDVCKTVRVMKAEREEEKDGLYEEVSRLLEDGVVNPLSELLDHGHLETLSEEERERHVLTLSRRVRDCVERFRKHAV